MTAVLVCDSEYDLSTQRRHVDALARKGIDGLVLSGLGRDKPYPALLEADFPPGAGVRPERSLPHRLRGHRRRGTAHHWAARGARLPSNRHAASIRTCPLGNTGPVGESRNS